MTPRTSRAVRTFTKAVKAHDPDVTVGSVAAALGISETATFQRLSGAVEPSGDEILAYIDHVGLPVVAGTVAHMAGGTFTPRSEDHETTGGLDLDHGTRCLLGALGRLATTTDEAVADGVLDADENEAIRNRLREARRILDAMDVRLGAAKGPMLVGGGR